MKRWLRVIVLSITLSSSSLAAADEPKPAPVREWYGWQTIATDAASIGVFLVAMSATEDPTLQHAGVWSSLGGYVLGGPIVHVAHGSGIAALTSLGIRIGSPLLMGGVGYVAFGGLKDHDGFAGLVGAIFGFGVGAISAMVTDAVALGYEERPVQAASFRVAPRLAVTPRAVHVGIGGTF